MPPADRAGVLLDLNALARAGQASPAALIRLLAAFHLEDNPNVWNAISLVVSALDKVLLGSNSPVYGHFQSFVAALLQPAAALLGWESSSTDGHLTRIMRSTLTTLVGRYSKRPEDAAVARARFDAVCASPLDPAACPSEFRTTVFQTVLRNGSAAEFHSLMGIYKQLHSDAERKQVPKTLKCNLTIFIYIYI